MSSVSKSILKKRTFQEMNLPDSMILQHLRRFPPENSSKRFKMAEEACKQGSLDVIEYLSPDLTTFELSRCVVISENHGWSEIARSISESGQLFTLENLTLDS